MTDFRRLPLGALLPALFGLTMPGLTQTKVPLRQLQANSFRDGCVVATAGALSTQPCAVGSGLGEPGGYTVVSFSGTPLFPVTKNTDQSFMLTLTGDVTNSIVDAAGVTNSGRPIVTFRVCQDTAGFHAFAWPASVLNHGTIDPTPGACSTQTFVFDGTNFQAIGNLLVTGVSGAAITLPGSTSGATKVQASTSAGGTLTLPARTATVATTLGTLPNGDCAKFDASGNLIDAGAACGSSSGFDPTDVTVLDPGPFYPGFLQVGSGSSGVFWKRAGTCSDFYTQPTPSAAFPAYLWTRATAGNSCLVTFPSDTGGSQSLWDFLSGSSPLPYLVQAYFAIDTFGSVTGDEFVGWSSANNAVGTFVGCRYDSANNKWRAQIINAGTVVSTADVGVTPDTNFHWVRASGDGTVGKVTCAVGSVSASTTGTVPSGGWFAVAGAASTGSNTPGVKISEVRLHITDRVAH